MQPWGVFMSKARQQEPWLLANGTANICGLMSIG